MPVNVKDCGLDSNEERMNFSIFIFFARVNRQSAALSSIILHEMPRKNGKHRIEYDDISSHGFCGFFCLPYHVRDKRSLLKKFLCIFRWKEYWSIEIYQQRVLLILIWRHWGENILRLTLRNGHHRVSTLNM